MDTFDSPLTGSGLKVVARDGQVPGRYRLDGRLWPLGKAVGLTLTLSDQSGVAASWHGRIDAGELPNTTRPMAVVKAASKPDVRVRRAQRDLTSLGYNPGPQDGFIGPHTRAAIRAYQADKGLRIDGRVSEALLAQLRRSVAAQRIAETPPAPAQTIVLDAYSHAPGVPRGYLPAPGYCRIWHSDRPAGHQPPPFRCDTEDPAPSPTSSHRQVVEPQVHPVSVAPAAPPPAAPSGGKNLGRRPDRRRHRRARRLALRRRPRAVGGDGRGHVHRRPHRP